MTETGTKLSSKELKRIKVQKANEELARQKFHQDRRRLLKRLALGGSAAALASVTALTIFEAVTAPDNAKKKEYQDLTDQDTTDKEALDQVLIKLDAGMENLGRLISRSQMVTPSRKAELMVPIEYSRQNKKINPERNFYALEIQDLQTRGIAALDSPLKLKTGNVDLFYYELLDDQEAAFAAAAYNALSRSVKLSPGIDDSNLLDMLITYHESTHAVQDGNARDGLVTDAQASTYYSFMSGDNIIGEWEYEAYMKEMLVFDLITGGQLKKDIQSQTDLNVDVYMAMLNARPEQRGLMETELKFAKVAFSSGSDIDNYTQPFTDYVNSQYEDLGLAIYKEQNGYFIRTN